LFLLVVVKMICRNFAARLKGPIQKYRTVSSLVSKYDESIKKLPLREAVRYVKPNLKWTAEEFNLYSDSHGNAMWEHNFKSGDTIAVWLPESAEKHVIFTVAAKLGMKVVDIDPELTSVTDIRSALTAAKCKALYFNPESETQNNLLLLRKSIPEFFYYDDSRGQHFHSKYFPTIKYFIHTGFDIENGCLNFKGLFLPHPSVNECAALSQKTTDEMPLYMKISKGKSGIEVGPTITQGKVLEDSNWSFAKKLINHEYFEL